MANAKGTALVQAVKTLRGIPGAADRLPPHLRHYLAERIIISNWYPEADYLGLLTALAKLFPAGSADPWELFGTHAAQHDLTTVYRGQVRTNTTLLGALRSVKDLFHLYHDTGRIVLTGDESRAQMDLFDYENLSADHCRFVTSYGREHLRMSLGREVTVKETRCRARGDDRCRREFAI